MGEGFDNGRQHAQETVTHATQSKDQGAANNADQKAILHGGRAARIGDEIPKVTRDTIFSVQITNPCRTDAIETSSINMLAIMDQQHIYFVTVPSTFLR